MTQTTPNASFKGAEPFLEKFRRFEAGPQSPAWLLPLRKAGLARFSELGFPTVHDEDWRFTNVAPLARLPFKPVVEAVNDTAAKTALEKYVFAHLPGSRLVFVNGHFHGSLSSVDKLPDGMKVASLAAALATDSAFIEQQLGRLALTEDNSFAALNQAFFLDGGFVHIPANQTVADPIQLIFISTAKHNGDTIQPRNLIIAGAGSRATVIESYLAGDQAAYFTNAVTEIVARDNAVLEHVKFQDEAPDAFHLATIAGNLGRTSNVNIHSFALGAKLSRNNIRAKLAGEGLECVLNGLYLTRGEQLADHHMIVEHAQPHCASHEYFNGILDDKSKGVFHGRIYVHPAAQKTDAKQTNKNLLLSDDATADTKPQLEIYADDVKCTHGATVGQLNEESIFYLRSRGLGKDTARRMLIHAFAGEIIARVKHDAVREELDKVIWDRLEANPHLRGI
ncbi:MAG: Fe-S cluster assembly protein SufD [Limisphaerales bacterium]